MVNTNEYTQAEMIDRDFPPSADDSLPNTPEFLKRELIRNAGKCYYDSERKQIVYHEGDIAYNEYMEFQRESIERYKWIESEKAGHDLGTEAIEAWIKINAPIFSKLWRQTHKCIDINAPAAERTQESPLAELCAA